MGQNFFSDKTKFANRAFLFGDAVKASFFVLGGKLVMAEECYFFLMASMRKMRMNIPLDYTLDFFENLFGEHILKENRSGIITFIAYRGEGELLAKNSVEFWFSFEENNFLNFQKPAELDILKEITVNTNLVSNIRVHCPEDIYAEIYAGENDLDDVILLNPNKRIARCTKGNLLFLQNDTIRIPKQTEGAKISPLMENFVTFIHKNNLAIIEEAEIIAFESQRAEEILIISDAHGIFPVSKIRNKTFGSERFAEMISKWRGTFNS